MTRDRDIDESVGQTCSCLVQRDNRQPSLLRQVSLPDRNVLADLWDEINPDELLLDPDSKEPGSGVLQLPPQASLGLRQSSAARYTPPAPLLYTLAFGAVLCLFLMGANCFSVPKVSCCEDRNTSLVQLAQHARRHTSSGLYSFATALLLRIKLIAPAMARRRDVQCKSVLQMLTM